jgi:hypothetical protein
MMNSAKDCFHHRAHRDHRENIFNYKQLSLWPLCSPWLIISFYELIRNSEIRGLHGAPLPALLSRPPPWCIGPPRSSCQDFFLRFGVNSSAKKIQKSYRANSRRTRRNAHPALPVETARGRFFLPAALLQYNGYP